MHRRAWMKTGALALAACAARAAETEETPLFSGIGIAAPLEEAARLRAAGVSFLTLSTSGFLVPDQGEAAFGKQLAALREAPLPVLACNGFIRPEHLRCVGPDANHDEVLAWADTAFRRLAMAGGKFIVFGSAGARRVPDGWARDKADAQFSELLGRMGKLAAVHDVTVTVEQLQEKECNFINRIGHVAALVRAAKHPNVRVLADLYHMRVMGDTPEDLRKALDVVAHMEIAELEGRTYPGVAGDDFRPFFRVLREADWKGAISIEGRGKPGQVAAAVRMIKDQAGLT